MPEALTPAAALAERSATPYPNESADYRAARTALLADEIDLRRAIERVAERRRALPPGGTVTGDYRFDGPDGPLDFAALFGRHDTLVTYSYMFGPEREQPCPMCTTLLDAWDGEAGPIGERVALVIVARSPLDRLEEWKRTRGWRGLTLVSDTTGAFTRDYHGLGEDGGEVPALNVFRRDDGAIRHFWGSEMGLESMDPGQDPRGAPDIMPIWTILDFTPEGRGTDWYPTLAMRV